LAIFKIAFRRVNHFAVFSRIERDIYSNAFGIDRGKFDFVHWGVSRPTVANRDGPLFPGEYVSAVGGNSRDYRTLIEAARSLPLIKFVLVVRPENLSGLEMPPNVVVRTNIPFGDAMNIISFSKLTIVPLDRVDAPCGHVTIVAAMYLDVPVVVTRSLGVEDYVSDGKTGLIVELKSPSSMVEAIARLDGDGHLRDQMASNSRKFAEQNCSERSVAEHFRQWLTVGAANRSATRLR
jgi:glycosyltransferase involved in cell wall biosynthesis